MARPARTHARTHGQHRTSGSASPIGSAHALRPLSSPLVPHRGRHHPLGSGPFRQAGVERWHKALGHTSEGGREGVSHKCVCTRARVRETERRRFRASPSSIPHTQPSVGMPSPPVQAPGSDTGHSAVPGPGTGLPACPLTNVGS